MGEKSGITYTRLSRPQRAAWEASGSGPIQRHNARWARWAGFFLGGLKARNGRQQRAICSAAVRARGVIMARGEFGAAGGEAFADVLRSGGELSPWSGSNR